MAGARAIMDLRTCMMANSRSVAYSSPIVFICYTFAIILLSDSCICFTLSFSLCDVSCLGFIPRSSVHTRSSHSFRPPDRFSCC